MSKFNSYTDKEGNKVSIGDWVEVLGIDEKIKKMGKVVKITNETFYGISVILEENPYEHINSKNTRKHVPKGDQISWKL